MARRSASLRAVEQKQTHHEETIIVTLTLAALRFAASVLQVCAPTSTNRLNRLNVKFLTNSVFDGAQISTMGGQISGVIDRQMNFQMGDQPGTIP